MVSFESLAIGSKFYFDGTVFTKISDQMARSEAGEYIADNGFLDATAESEIVETI